MKDDKDLSITKKKCPRCLRSVVVAADGSLARHRLPAPRNNGQFAWIGDNMVLGEWYK